MLMRVYYFEFKLFEFVKIVLNYLINFVVLKDSNVVVEKCYCLLCFIE